MARPSTSSQLWKKLAAGQSQDLPPPFGWTVHTEPEPPSPDKRELCERFCQQREHFRAIRRQRIEAVRWTGREICRRVAEKHGLTLEGFLTRTHKRPFAYARQEAAYKMALLTKLTLQQMGAVLGGYDHTTVLHGIRAYAQRHDLPPLRGIKPKARKP